MPTVIENQPIFLIAGAAEHDPMRPREIIIRCIEASADDEVRCADDLISADEVISGIMRQADERLFKD